MKIPSFFRKRKKLVIVFSLLCLFIVVMNPNLVLGNGSQYYEGVEKQAALDVLEFDRINGLPKPHILHPLHIDKVRPHTSEELTNQSCHPSFTASNPDDPNYYVVEATKYLFGIAVTKKQVFFGCRKFY